MWLFYYFNFEMNYDDLKSKGPCILLNENINFDKYETKSIMENSTYSFRETNMWLSSYKSRKLKAKLWWIGARERKQICVFFKDLCFFSMYRVLNTLSENTLFWITKNITSCTFVAWFWNRWKPSVSP